MTRRTSTISRRQRAQVEAVIEQLIALLDTLDSDADAEPSLGSPEAQVGVPWGGMNWWSPPALRATGGPEHRTLDGTQVRWAAQGASALDGEWDAGEEPELVNEDGADSWG